MVGRPTIDQAVLVPIPNPIGSAAPRGGIPHRPLLHAVGIHGAGNRHNESLGLAGPVVAYKHIVDGDAQAHETEDDRDHDD